MSESTAKFEFKCYGAECTGGGYIGLQEDFEDGVCPQCGSEDYFVVRHYRCDDCGRMDEADKFFPQDQLAGLDEFTDPVCDLGLFLICPDCGSHRGTQVTSEGEVIMAVPEPMPW